MKILNMYVSLSDWGRPDDKGCRDKSDIVTDMVLDDTSNLVCPKTYTFYDSDGTRDSVTAPRHKRAPPPFAR